MDDAATFLKTCDSFGVPAALERSRSGQGGHVWIFFDNAVPAVLARKMGSALLTYTLEKRHQLGLDSYDRFFPSQDTLPKGGFGNLIALPLQKIPRESGNSVFLDRDFHFHEDQWACLSALKRMKQADIEKLICEASSSGTIIDVPLSVTDDENAEEPWNPPVSRNQKDKLLKGPFPAKATIVLANRAYIEKAGLPPAMLNKLLHLAAFQNPEFYKAQAMRLSTFGKPRIISCGDDLPQYICLPRGCLDEAKECLEEYKIKVEIRDERFSGKPIVVDFNGELRPNQKEAAKTMLEHDMGVLSATTAFGKTVVAAWLIAQRKVNTLILVHRRQLMDQWQERLSLFLGLDKKGIGLIGGGKNKQTGKIDIAVLQSLSRKGEVKDLIGDCGQIIVDECHHLSAFSFEQALKEAKAKYVLGLTATPIRKDGHHAIIMMQCGPIRYRVSARQEANARPF